MKIPGEARGTEKVFVSFGESPRTYVSLNDGKGLEELKKLFHVYPTFKKHAFLCILKKAPFFLKKVRLQTGASLIYERQGEKFFLPEKGEVITHYDTLARYQKNLKGPALFKHIKTPEILWHDDEKKLISTEYLDSKTLRISEFAPYVEDIIKMVESYSGKEKKVKIEEYLKTLSKAERELIRRRFKKHGTDKKTIKVCLSHGDFHPGNLIFDGNEFRVVDFDQIGTRPKIHDLIYFSLIPYKYNNRNLKASLFFLDEFVNQVKTTIEEYIVSVSLIRPNAVEFHKFLDDHNLFLDRFNKF